MRAEGKKAVLIITLCLLFFTGCKKEVPAPPDIFPGHLISHRGGTVCPENTGSAFEWALENGYRLFEADVKVTSDMIPVILHDDTLERTSNGEGEVSEKTYEELLELDFGEWFSEDFKGEKILSLEEFLKFCKENRCFGELDLVNKNIGTDALLPVYEAVKKTGTEDITIFTANVEQAEKLCEMSEGDIIICVSGMVDSEHIQDALKRVRTKTLIMSVPEENYKKKLCSLCHRGNCYIKVWTVNDIEKMNRLLEDGVDLVITDSITEGDIARENDNE